MDLEELRGRLDSVDRQLVELVAERQNIVSEIGRMKYSSGKATRDYQREKDVLELAARHARELGVDPNLAERILRALIHSSLASQEKDRVVAEGKGDGRRVLVFGGAG
jgi:chorismate mutase/prephenate dehydrogenase